MPYRTTTILVLLAALAIAAAAPDRARAGTFTQILCADPVSGVGVTPDAQLPDGLTNPANHAPMGAVGTTGRCSTGRGLFLPTNVTTAVSSSGASLVYRAGQDLRFRSAMLYRSWVGMSAWGLFVNRGDTWDHMWTQPWDDRCQANAACHFRGDDARGTFLPTHRIDLTAGAEPANGFTMSVLCDPSNSGSCQADGYGLRIYGGTVTLEDTSDPQVVGTPSGSLLDSTTLSGQRDLTVAGTDVGAGVYRVRLLLNDAVAQTQIVSANGGTCADARPEDADPYQFTVRRPCKPSASGSLVFDTTKLPEGQATMKLQLEDAGGNATTFLSRSVIVDNVSAPVLLAGPQLSGAARRGSSLAMGSAAWDDRGVEGDPIVERRWQRCLRDGSGCQDIAGASGSTYTLTTSDLNRRIRGVELARNSEGESQAATGLSAVVTREDGTLPADNDGIDNDGDGAVDEPGESGPSAPGPNGPGDDQTSGIGATPLTGSAGRDGTAGANGRDGSTGAAGVNGEGGSSQARLTVAWTKTVSKSTITFGRTAKVQGRLVDEHGRPIRNAIIDVAETRALAGARAAAGRPAVTGSDGSFTYAASSKPGTRQLAFAYRYQREGVVVAQATLRLTVKATVSLAVKLKGVVASYSGKVRAGSMPRGGKLVIVQGRAKGGSWQTFGSRRASKKNGVYKGRYRLKVRVPGRKLQFRVRVLAESGWNFRGVTSKPVTRTVR